MDRFAWAAQIAPNLRLKPPQGKNWVPAQPGQEHLYDAETGMPFPYMETEGRREFFVPGERNAVPNPPSSVPPPPAPAPRAVAPPSANPTRPSPTPTPGGPSTSSAGLDMGTHDLLRGHSPPPSAPPASVPPHSSRSGSGVRGGRVATAPIPPDTSSMSPEQRQLLYDIGAVPREPQPQPSTRQSGITPPSASGAVRVPIPSGQQTTPAPAGLRGLQPDYFSAPEPYDPQHSPAVAAMSTADNGGLPQSAASRISDNMFSVVWPTESEVIPEETPNTQQGGEPPRPRPATILEEGYRQRVEREYGPPSDITGRPLDKSQQDIRKAASDFVKMLREQSAASLGKQTRVHPPGTPTATAPIPSLDRMRDADRESQDARTNPPMRVYEPARMDDKAPLRNRPERQGKRNLRRKRRR